MTTGAPVVGTYQAAGAVSHDLVDRFGGRVGLFRNQPGDQLLHEADLVISIGYNPVEYDPSLWNVDDSRQIIHIDVIAAELDNHYAPAVELIGDIAATVDMLPASVSRLPRSETPGGHPAPLQGGSRVGPGERARRERPCTRWRSCASWRRSSPRT